MIPKTHKLPLIGRKYRRPRLPVIQLGEKNVTVDGEEWGQNRVLNAIFLSQKGCCGQCNACLVAAAILKNEN